MADTIRVGTRGSKLALWQANWVKGALERLNAEIACELVVIKTKGDKILDVPLAKVGGKGLFVKEIEEALLDGRIDLAVHSMKDMPAEIPAGLCIGGVHPQGFPGDVIIRFAVAVVPTLHMGKALVRIVQGAFDKAGQPRLGLRFYDHLRISRQGGRHTCAGGHQEQDSRINRPRDYF